VGTKLSLLDQQKIATAIHVPSVELTIEPLGGGVLARSFRISCNVGEWVARMPVTAKFYGTLELSVEQQLLQTVAAARLTPGVVRCDGLLISEFLHGARTWSADDFREPGNFTRVADRLRELHRVEHDLPAFYAVPVAERYIKCFAKRQLTGEQQGWARELEALASAYDAESSPGVLCHNDLVAANILDDGEVWFIDFEYAVCAEPILDLAGLVSMNQLNSSQRTALVAAYYLDETPPFGPTKLSDVVRMTQLISYFWALASQPRPNSNSGIERFVDQMEAVLR